MNQLPRTEDELETILGQTVVIPIDRIKPDPENLREIFDEQDILDLGKNMQQVGQMDDLTVFPVNDESGNWTGDFDLHDGERRWRAARMVGIQTLRARIEARPSSEELLFKKLSRMLQTRTLPPEQKVTALERGLQELGVIEKPEMWESYKEHLGGGQEWPQIVRVLKLNPGVRKLMEEGSINFTLAQSIGRLPSFRQEEAATFVVTQRINGRYFSTQIVPYLLENPNANLAQAFEHTKVGEWRQYMHSPYEKGHEPPTEEKLEKFLESCVTWERAWEVMVHTGLVQEIQDNPSYAFRMKEAARRIVERSQALVERIEKGQRSETISELPTTRAMLKGGNH